MCLLGRHTPEPLSMVSLGRLHVWLERLNGNIGVGA